jgi:hypothetical protein
MENLNVTAGDSRDGLQRGKFFYGSADYALFPSNDGEDWTSEYRYYRMEKVNITHKKLGLQPKKIHNIFLLSYRDLNVAQTMPYLFITSNHIICMFMNI